MPVTKYQRDIIQTVNDKVNGTQLMYELAAAIPLVAVDHVDVGIEPTMLDVYMADALDAAQEAVLDATITAHQGFGYVSTLKGTLPLVKKEQAIASDVAWEVIEGVLTTPRFFTDDVSQLVARIIGEHKGDGGQLALWEEVDGQANEEKINPAFAFPDTAGGWQKFKVDSNVAPRDGTRNLYRADGRLNGAAALSLRYCTISMVEVVIVP